MSTIPRTVTRQQVVAALDALGLGGQRVRELSLGRESGEVVVTATGDDGMPFLTDDGRIAADTIAFRVVD